MGLKQNKIEISVSPIRVYEKIRDGMEKIGLTEVLVNTDGKNTDKKQIIRVLPYQCLQENTLPKVRQGSRRMALAATASWQWEIVGR